MKRIYILLTILISQTICFGQDNNTKTLINEEYYIQVRNSLDRNINANIDFKDPNLYKKNDVFLDSLNHLLKVVLQDHPLKETFSNSKSSLVTLLPELGYEKLDALQIWQDSILLSYTTAEIFEDYYSGQYNIDSLSILDLGWIIQSLEPEAATFGLWFSKLSPFDNIDQVYFIIALESQDPLYTQSKSIYAIWNIKNHIYILRPIEFQITLNESATQWRVVSENQRQKLEDFKNSNPNLSRSEYRSYENKLEREAYAKYGECYQSEANQIIIDNVKKSIINLIDQIIGQNDRSR